MAEELKPQDIVQGYNEMLGVIPEGGQQPPEATPAPEVPPVEPVATEPQPEPPAPPQETDWFDLNKINTRFGTEFKTEEEIKEYISSLNDNREFLGKRDTYLEMEKVFEEMQNQFSPENMVKAFGTKENYEKAVMHNVLSQNMPASVASAILTTDMGKEDDLQVIFLEAISRDPSLLNKMGGELNVKKGILSRLGVDTNDPEFDLTHYQEAAKNNPRVFLDLSMGATQAKSYFKELIETAKKEIPEIKDFKQEFEQRAKGRAEILQKRTNDWTTKAKDLASEFKEFEYRKKDAQGKEYVDFKFAVPKEFQDNVANYLQAWAVENNLDLTPETVAKAKQEVYDTFKAEYSDEIHEARMAEKLAKYKEELDNKVHNIKPINTQEAPPEHGKSPEDEINEQLKHFGLA